MSLKKILITGATDGIGYETAKKLKSLGHTILVHGRNKDKLKRIGVELNAETFKADLSSFSEVKSFANDIIEKHKTIDILINNAGVYKTSKTITEEGLDVRFVVNTISPYLLTNMLLPIINNSGRIINLSSAAQSSVDFDAFSGKKELDDFEAYAQSKLGLSMWSRYLANKLNGTGPIVISVNPGSLLGTKMVKEGFGADGNDINIGVDILVELALDNKHKDSNGKYFDNDLGRFTQPKADGLNDEKTKKLISILEKQFS